MNLCIPSGNRRTDSSHTSKWKESFASCHGSRVPLKPCVRKPYECGRHWWMVGPGWQGQWLRDPESRNPSRSHLGFRNSILTFLEQINRETRPNQAAAVTTSTHRNNQNCDLSNPRATTAKTHASHRLVPRARREHI